MTHLKKVGLILAAVAAMMAFGGAASASAAEFHTNTVGAELHGTQTGTHVFKVQGQSVTCKVAEFTGETTALTSTTQTVHPEYRECTAFGFIGATVVTTGCDYRFASNGGTVDIVCAISNNITISGGGCHVVVKGQNGVNGISYTNAANKLTQTVHTASTNIHANVTTSHFPCPLSKTTSTTSTYTGTTSVTAGGATLWWE